MEKSIFNITEYRVNQDIDFTGVTSFKVLNHGESLVDINTISVYPGETTTLVEADTTFCDFNLKSVFTHPTDTDGIIYFKTNTAGTYDLVLLDFNEFHSGVKTMDVTDIGVEQQMNFGAFSRENHYEGLTLAFKSFTKDEQILFALTNEEPWAIEL